MLDDIITTSYGNPFDKLIVYFYKKQYFSFMYVMHDMDLTFVIHRITGVKYWWMNMKRIKNSFQCTR